MDCGLMKATSVLMYEWLCQYSAEMSNVVKMQQNLQLPINLYRAFVVNRGIAAPEKRQ